MACTVTIPRFTGSARQWRAARYGTERGWRSGFTLIELLVVISIISLLIAILLPVLGTVRQRAATVTCQSGQRQIGLALHMYEGDYGFMPWNNGARYNARGGPLTLSTGLVGKGYLPNDDPEIPGTRGSKIMRCPGDPNRVLEQYHLSYFYRQTVNGLQESDNRDYFQAVRTWIWPGPYEGSFSKWLVADAMRLYEDSRQPEQQKPFPGEATTDSSSPYPGPDNVSINSLWHNEGANFLYHDGHVSWVPYGQLPAEF